MHWTTGALVLIIALAAGCASRDQDEKREDGAKADQTGEAGMKDDTKGPGGAGLDRDVFETSQGPLAVTFVGHASLMFESGGKVVHVDPVSKEGDYSALPDADLILVTHDHFDHLDADAIAKVRKEDTVVVCPESCADKIEGAAAMKNGDARTEFGMKIEAVPAYNIEHKRPSGEPFHPKGRGNGYLLDFGNLRVYIAGDTENIPEMKLLKDVGVAFLPMNLPYTMTPEMAADAARAVKARVVYPYHFGDTDTQALVKLLEGEEGMEVRIRDMK